jgi:3-hydroxyanthranilate 3,4-dioxygenase
MQIVPPFNLHKWIEENRHLLRPPVCNATLFKGNENFMVMVVGGPNARKDFHINSTEELFYQIEGNINLHIIVDGKLQIVPVNEGDMFLLPPNVPHSPRRGVGTVGLVIEQYRHTSAQDGFQWYCENCGHLLHEEYLPVNDIVGQLPVVMNAFYNSKELTTCKKCGSVMEKP